MTGWEGIYCGPAPAPEEILLRWNLDPWALAVIAGLALLSGRSRPGYAAVVVLTITFLSPLCALSAALFSARVVHHVLLVAIAAPLLALARPSRRSTGAGLPFLLATAALWLWHLPVAYDAALSDMAVYWVMQASLLALAWMFWRAVFSQPAGAGVVWVFLGYLGMGMLGAILTLAPNGLYAAHASAPLMWGMTPLADQQLGGLVMWMPAGLPYAVWGGMLARRAWRATGTA
ncbi:cytochrome c oxidase assembly protein [Tabrizicola sp.]|uniref:cytochrome c oxidase assembly protein n=1 Tax=Tabrizicola sp. TaxID=2005166 RepID=UPI002733FB3D|nr:cytochrome c oxidase assembly protein [Tabrizicola sp.]MDP3195164.1 cytochrome c oxidase assembly protein [Tabrizicola sp.]